MEENKKTQQWASNKRQKRSELHIPRVTLAVEIEDNFVHLIRDTKPLIAFYRNPRCEICDQIRLFFKTFICEEHYNALQGQLRDFVTCPKDLLFPFEIESKKNHHTVLYRWMRDKRSYEEIKLLDSEKETITVTNVIRKLKTSLHLMPSENKWVPQIHQQHKVQWYDQNVKVEEAYMVHEGLGCGKTSGILYMLEMGQHHWPSYVTTVCVVCPNTIIEYWHQTINTLKCFRPAKEIQKPLHFKIMGYAAFEKLCHDHFAETLKLIRGKTRNEARPTQLFLSDSIVVVDEAQHFRNMTTAMQYSGYALQFSYQTISLTGTMLINDSEDILGGICLMKGARSRGGSLPFQRPCYYWKSVQDLSLEIEKWRVWIANKDVKFIENTFRDRSYYFDPQIHAVDTFAQHYPLIQQERHQVEMSLPQMFDYLRHQKKTILIGDVAITSAVRNSYNTLLKSLSNFSPCSTEQLSAPKFDKISEKIDQIGEFPQVVFSRFLDNGVKTFHQKLKRKHPGKVVTLMTGDTPNHLRGSIQNEYNRQKIDILGLSNVGGIGLDLKHTKALHLMEQFDNEQTETQATRRVARFNSHYEEEAKIRPVVQIHKYLSIFPSLERKEFRSEEIREVEKAFDAAYGSFLTLRKNPLHQTRLAVSTERERANGRYYIADILLQLIEQLPHTKETIEEQMAHRNMQKAKDMEPFFQAFIRCAYQLPKSPEASSQINEIPCFSSHTDISESLSASTCHEVQVLH